MADILPMNPIIAIISFGRGEVSLEKKETEGKKKIRASLCVEALEMCLHRRELCAWKQTLPVARLYQIWWFEPGHASEHSLMVTVVGSASPEGWFNPRSMAMLDKLETTEYWRS